MVQMVLNKVRRQRKTGNFRLLMLLLCCCSSLISFGQRPIVALTADEKNAEVDETIVFRVSTNVEGPINIDFPSEFEVDYGVMHQISQEMDPTGKLKTYYITQNSGSFNKTGNYSFYATVKYKGHVFKSNKITLTIEENKNTNVSIKSSDPVFGYIEAKKTTIYEGESLLLNAKVISRYPIVNIEGYQPFKNDKNAEEHVFTNVREYVEESKLNGKTVQTFEYGKQLLIPVATGKCRIKPFEMALRCHSSIFDRTFHIKSTGLTITVKPLPKGAPSNFIGGVGEFELTSELSDVSKLKAGDVFQLKVIVTGTGNLHNISDPKIIIPSGCKLYGDVEREEEFEYTENGVSGAIVFIYNIQLLNEGEFVFDAPGISYFDPNKAKYITLFANPFTILLGKKNSTIIGKNPTKPATTKDIVMGQAPAKSGTKSVSGTNWPVYLGVGVPGVACAFFLFFLIARKKKTKEEHQRAVLLEEKENSLIEAQTTDFWSQVLQDPHDLNHISVLLPKAIIQILEKKFGLQNTSRERVLSALGDSNQATEQEIRQIMSACDHYRYGFGSQDLPAEQLISRVKELLRL